MYELDSTVTQGINGLARSLLLLDQLMVWTSLLGIPILVALVAAQWWRRRERTSVRHALIASGLSFVLGLAMNQIILLLLHRVRPYDAGLTQLLIPPSSDWSFPSDHATATMAIAATFLLHRMPRLGSAFLAASLLMMISRVYVGVHYVGDVLAGAVTGGMAALVVSKLYRQGTRLDRLITGIF